MTRLKIRQLVTTGALAGLVGLAGAPLSASAMSQSGHRDGSGYGYSYDRHDNRHDYDRHDRHDNDRHKRHYDRHDNDRHKRHNDWNRHYNRGHQGRHHLISQWRAIHIAKRVFPHKRVSHVQLRWDGWSREYQVRFTDGSRVDVRAYDGRVTFVYRAHHYDRHHHYNY